MFLVFCTMLQQHRGLKLYSFDFWVKAFLITCEMKVSFIKTFFVQTFYLFIKTALSIRKLYFNNTNEKETLVILKDKKSIVQQNFLEESSSTTNKGIQ